MEVFTNYHHLPLFKTPIALTIGSFDGLHLGHQKIFHTLKQLKEKHSGSTVVITFSNHPIEVLKSITVPKITPLEEKLALLKDFGVDTVILLEFSQELQNLSYDTFIKNLRETIPFTHLILGHGSTLGHNKEGNESRIKELANFLKFEAIYLEKASYENTIISSKTIREKLELGDVETARNLLGRPFAIYAPFHLEKLQETGEHRLKVTFDFQNHCTLPSGYYIVNLNADGFTSLASAYLTTLSIDKVHKTFDLEILIKGATSPFMNDHIKIEFLRKIPSSKTFDEMIESSDKIKPLNLS